MSFGNAARNYNYTRTTNGMVAHKTSGSAVLDLFNAIGSSRGKNIDGFFEAAWAENQDLTLRVALWARDITQGAGERQTFRNFIAWLENKDPEAALKIMPKVPALGRFDDLFSYTKLRNEMLGFYAEALKQGNGLAAKWAKRKGPMAVALARFMQLSPKQYRKMIVGLTTVVETLMAGKRWDEINFSHVPSIASSRYQKAFGRNASERYSAYIEELKKPKEKRDSSVKINAGAIFPHQVIRNISNGNVDVANAQWETLPNYVGDNSVFAIADTSGSMGFLPYSRYGGGSYHGQIQPIEISVALALYTASKNKGDFKDLFMIFDHNPRLVHLHGDLEHRVRSVPEIVASNTNLERAFEMLLDIAVRGRVSQADMPKTLLILSDMQFDGAVTGYNDRAQDMIRKKYQAAGYEMPRVVYWNLRSYSTDVAVEMDERGTAIVSGFSPAILKSVLANDLDDYSPYNVMMRTIMNERYNWAE